MYKSITLSNGIAFPAFRQEKRFQTFIDFLNDNLDAATLAHADIQTEYCLITGCSYGIRSFNELLNMVRIIAVDVVGDMDKDILNPPTQEAIESWLEEIFDRLHRKSILTSRPAPSFRVSNDRLVLQHLSKHQQFMALWSCLAYDTGLFSKSIEQFDLENQYRKQCDLIEMAKVTAPLFQQGPNIWHEIHALLIELDAKYQIVGFALTKKEKARLEGIIRAEPIEQASQIKSLLTVVLDRMDQQGEVKSYPVRWSQKTYGSVGFHKAGREDKSNVLAAMKKESKPSNSHVKAPKTEAEALRQRRANAMRNAFAGLKGKLEL